jgi:hypothetical protein
VCPLGSLRVRNQTRSFLEPILYLGVTSVMLRKEWTLDLYKLLLGALLFGSPWMFTFVSEPAKIDAWVTGLIIITIAAATLIAFDDRQEWCLLAVATWMIACPWLLRMPHATGMRVHIGIGLLVAYLAIFELWLIHYNPYRSRSEKGR